MAFSWKYCVGSVGAVLVALGYFAYNQQWVIIQGPRSSVHYAPEVSHKSVTKKRVKRIFWHHDAWHTEETELLWSDDKAENCKHLITSWLTLLDEEGVMEKRYPYSQWCFHRWVLMLIALLIVILLLNIMLCLINWYGLKAF